MVTEEKAVSLREVKAWPNPFEHQLVITYEIDSDTPVQVDLFNAMGQHIETIVPLSEQVAGLHQHKLNGTSLSSGMYLVTIKTPGTRKLIRVIKP